MSAGFEQAKGYLIDFGTVIRDEIKAKTVPSLHPGMPSYGATEHDIARAVLEKIHKPLETERGVVDCTCGYRQVGYYSEDVGARGGFLEHLLAATIEEAGWPAQTFLEYEEREVR